MAISTACIFGTALLGLIQNCLGNGAPPNERYKSVYPVLDASQRNDSAIPPDAVETDAWNASAGVVFQRYSPDNDLSRPR